MRGRQERRHPDLAEVARGEVDLDGDGREVVEAIFDLVVIFVLPRFVVVDHNLDVVVGQSAFDGVDVVIVKHPFPDQLVQVVAADVALLLCVLDHLRQGGGACVRLLAWPWHRRISF